MIVEMLEARAAYECRLYIELHDCGETEFPAGSQVFRTAEGSSRCPKCGKARKLEFLLDPDLEPPPPAFRRAEAADTAPENIRALNAENDSADVLARHGYDVEQAPTVPGPKRPDYKIGGEVFDNYAPTTSNVRSIWDAVGDKVAKKQANRIVLNLTGTTTDLTKLKQQFDAWPIDGLEQILVVKDGKVIRFWP